MEIVYNEIKPSAAFPQNVLCQVDKIQLVRTLVMGFNSAGSQDVSVLCQRKYRNDTAQ